ncbi:hypothetical protein J6590_084578 [Homalodisca vitripennis]|nr:hypothetical protein J6590_084578 [Homalodisca vitripennis]
MSNSQGAGMHKSPTEVAESVNFHGLYDVPGGDIISDSHGKPQYKRQIVVTGHTVR